MRPTNVLVHGFNEDDPMDTIGTLTPYIHEPQIFDYGWTGLLSVLWHNKDYAAQLLIKYRGRKVNIIAHSNGAAVAVAAARQGLDIETLIILSPALKVNTRFPLNIKRVIILYTPYDIPTKVASMADRIPFIRLFVPNAWGAMGAKGAKYNQDQLPKYLDSRVRNYEASDVQGHSHWFKGKALKKYGHLICACTNF